MSRPPLLSPENFNLYDRIWGESVAVGDRRYWPALGRLMDAARAEGRRSGILDSGRACEIQLSDQVSNEFLEFVPAEIWLKVTRLARDAARYRWLRDDNAYAPEEANVSGGEELDELCDGWIAFCAVRSALGGEVEGIISRERFR